MQAGLLAAFKEANDAGGVHGRMLSLTSYDDGYEPDKSIEQVRKLIEVDRVFALIGPVGTPTSSATLPLAKAAGVPFIGAFTGAGFLRDASHGNVVNVRASYGAETETWIQDLVDGQKMSKIALLYQDDSFGRVGLDGVTAALERRGMKLVAEATYQRNTVAVKSALLELRRAEPDAVVMVGAYQPVAEFIKLARSINFNPTFVNISFVGSNALASELGPHGEGVVISQVVPFPWDKSLPLVSDYHAALAASDPDEKPGFVSLEGYMVGRLAVQVLQQTGPDVTREAFLGTVFEKGPFDIGGVTLSFGPDDNQGMDEVFMTEIQADGSFTPRAMPGS
jgi:ABC-type branched-subunit amino acid transport system substrate-binding protein